MVGGGFEPPKASPTDLQSVPFGRSGTPPIYFGIGHLADIQRPNVYEDYKKST